METKVVVNTHIEKLLDDWDFGLDFVQENGDFQRAKDFVKEACEEFEISENALEAIDRALNYLADTLIEELVQDLKDMWKRLNKIEKAKWERVE